MKNEWSDLQENNPPVAQDDSDFETWANRSRMNMIIRLVQFRRRTGTSKTSLFFDSSLGHSNLLRIRFEGKRRPWKGLSAAMLTVQPHIHQLQQRWAFSKKWLTGRLDNSWTRAFSLCWYRRMVFFFSGSIVCVRFEHFDCDSTVRSGRKQQDLSCNRAHTATVRFDH